MFIESVRCLRIWSRSLLHYNSQAGIDNINLVSIPSPVYTVDRFCCRTYTNPLKRVDFNRTAHTNEPILGELRFAIYCWWNNIKGICELVRLSLQPNKPVFLYPLFRTLNWTEFMVQTELQRSLRKRHSSSLIIQSYTGSRRCGWALFERDRARIVEGDGCKQTAEH